MQRRCMALCLLVLFLAGLASCTVQSPQEYYSQSGAQEKQAGTATVVIDCSTVLQNMDLLDPSIKESDLLPKDGILLKETQVAFAQGDTVFDLLSKATKAHKIQMEYQGAQDSGAGALYIKGIGHLYEFSCGAQSGWSYRVNGKFPSLGCDSYKLTDGDRVQWLYTCDMGQDIGNAAVS